MLALGCDPHRGQCGAVDKKSHLQVARSSWLFIQAGQNELLRPQERSRGAVSSISFGVGGMVDEFASSGDAHAGTSEDENGPGYAGQKQESVDLASSRETVIAASA
ncbi:hypothetical protein DXG01_001422 [Tephrocybe rancida]|nr:hypothetical protein DXG01_001422 [Tephrocybe rancida]